jgi:hypothetical protein
MVCKGILKLPTFKTISGLAAAETGDLQWS